MSRVGLFRILWLGAFLLVGACTSAPREELNAYDNAFQEARLAGDAVLDKVAPIIAERAGVEGCPITRAGYPKCFDALSVLTSGRSNDPRPILVRRAALQTIADYNSVLLAIADGRFNVGSTAQINDLVVSGQTLLKLASVAAPGLPSLLSGPATQALGGLITEVQNVRSALELRRAVTAGAPTVQEMLYALAADTPKLYEIYLTAKKKEIGNAIAKGLPDLERKAKAEANAYHDSLEKYVIVLNETSQALHLLTTIAAKNSVTTADIRAIVGQAAVLRSKADAFWSAASKAPS